jgi:hypothetical protein
VAPDDPHELAGHVECTDTVREARVRRSRIEKFRKAQLPNAPQPLKRRGLNDAPQRLLELIRSKLDQLMDWIADPPRLRLCDKGRANAWTDRKTNNGHQASRIE